MPDLLCPGHFYGPSAFCSNKRTKPITRLLKRWRVVLNISLTDRRFGLEHFTLTTTLDDYEWGRTKSKRDLLDLYTWLGEWIEQNPLLGIVKIELMDRDEDVDQWTIASEVLWGNLREKLSPDYLKDHPCSNDITGARKIIDDARTKILRAHPTEFIDVPHCDLAANDVSISWFCHSPLIDRHLGISLHEIPHPTNEKKQHLSCDEALKCFNKEVEKLESMRYQVFLRNIRDKRSWAELKNYIHCVFALSCDRMVYPPLNTKGKNKSN